MKRIRLITVPLAMTALLTSIAALAVPPPQCGGHRSATYRMAYNTRTNYLNTLFRNSYDCGSFESFSSAARLLLLRSTFADPCQAAGVQDATNDTLDALARQCLNVSPGGSSSAGGASVGSPAEEAAAVSCERMGRDTATNAAQFYCVPPPPGAEVVLPSFGTTCGATYRYACEREFYRIVQQDPSCRQRARTDPNFATAVESACNPNP